MTWQVVSDRFVHPKGAVLTESDLVGCNIMAAVEAGHLTSVKANKPRKAARTPARAEEQ